MDTSIYKEKPHEKFVWFLIYININPAQFKSLLKRSSISIEYTFSILGVLIPTSIQLAAIQFLALLEYEENTYPYQDSFLLEPKLGVLFQKLFYLLIKYQQYFKNYFLL